MRPLTVAVSVLLTLTSARAADLSGVLADYLLRKVPPTESRVIDMTQYPGMSDVIKGMSKMTNADAEKMKASLIAQGVTWNNPAKLSADSMNFIYLYKLGPNYWTLVLNNPRLPLSDYMGTTMLRMVGQNPSVTGLNIYRVEGGRFSGFLVEDGVVRGSRMVVLLTPQVVAESRTMSQYLK